VRDASSIQRRRIHSSIDSLPKELKDALQRMVVDNTWPGDYAGPKVARPTYENMAAYIRQKGGSLSVHAIGRFARRLRTIARMKEAGQVVRDTMNNLAGENASVTQKAAAEMVTAHILEFLVEGKDLDSRALAEVARAVKDSTAVVLAADKYGRERMAEKLQQTKKEIAGIKPPKRIDPETLRTIREQVYGIIDTHLGRLPQH